jgi:aspartate aminotransferase-like enzyme
VLRAPSAGEAAVQMRAAFPKATRLHEAAKTVGTTSEALIRKAGFEVMADPTRRLPNHCCITHPDGAEGFTDENLAELARAFTNTTGH